MSHHAVAYLLSGSLLSFELLSLVAVTIFRRHTMRRMPRAYAHLARGVKTTSYRLFAAMDTMAVAAIVTGSPWTGTAILSYELITKFALYYAHEWLWSIRMLRQFLTHPTERE